MNYNKKVMYLDTALEFWHNTYNDEKLSLIERSNYFIREELIKLKKDTDTSAAINKLNSKIIKLFDSKGDEIILSTDKGRVIRCAAKEIRSAGRNTQGVRIIKLSGEEKVVSAIKIEDNFK